jgi:ATP-dependent RNA circularization protein (DNA/RNA ligase family)
MKELCFSFSFLIILLGNGELAGKINPFVRHTDRKMEALFLLFLFNIHQYKVQGTIAGERYLLII